MFLVGCGSEDPLPVCSKTSCSNGCCDQRGICQLGNTEESCGKGGFLCMVCSSGEKCTSGECMPAVTCGPSNCPNGCCLNGQCVDGTSNAACGRGGGACGVCQAPAVCTNYACASPSVCNANVCASGCCQNGKCMQGNTNQACGTGGNNCAVCQYPAGCANFVCSSNPANCNTSSCGQGCCTNGICQAGDTNGACGTGGVACIDCSKVGVCSNKKCAVNPQSLWIVKVGKVEVDTNYKEEGLPFFTAPDIYVVVEVGGQKKETSVADEKYVYEFNQETITTQAQSLVLGIKITVMDKNIFPLQDKAIGQCTMTLSYDELAQGSKTMTLCGGTDVKNVTLLFEPQ
jgi:hypothetical protein